MRTANTRHVRLIALLAVSVGLLAAGPSSAAAPVKVKDGRYAGGSKGVQAFLDISNRSPNFGRGYNDQATACTGYGGPLLNVADPVDAKGHFKLKSNLFPGYRFVIKGKFTNSHHIVGTYIWGMSGSPDPDCNGSHRYAVTLDRFAGLTY